MTHDRQHVTKICRALAIEFHLTSQLVCACAQVTAEIFNSLIKRWVIVIEQHDILAFQIFVKKLHHLDHFFWWIFGTDHHVNALEISLALEITAVTAHRCDHDERSYCCHNCDNRSHNAQGRIRTDRRHDVHCEK